MRLLIFLLAMTSIASGCNRQKETRNPPEIVSRDSDTVFNEIPGQQHLGRNAYDLNIVGMLKNVRKRLVFVDELRKTGLLDTLEQEGPYTVFAPTDHAFSTANTTLSVRALKAYIVPGEIRKADLASGSVTAQDLNGEQVTVSLENGKMIINDKIPVILEDIGATNGVIHEIDQLMEKTP